MFSAKVFALDTGLRYHGIASQSCRAESVLFALAESGSRMASDSRRLSILTAQAWRNVNLIGNFDFTTSSSPVDIDALAQQFTWSGTAAGAERARQPVGGGNVLR